MLRDADATAVRLSDYRPYDWLIDKVELDFQLDPKATRVRSKLVLRPNPKGRKDAPVVLDGDELSLLSILLDGKPLSANEYDASASGLTIKNPPRGKFTLEIETVVNPSANTKLMGLFRSNAIYCTQCEAEGFRRITYFPDRPDVLSVYTVRIEADRDEAPILLANGNPVEAFGIKDTNRHYAVWHDPFPKPSYLFALVGGKLDYIEEPFRTVSGRKVMLRIFVEPDKTQLAGYAMDALKRSMRWDEKVFGCEYDLDVFHIVAVSDFNMGAMENKGLNIFNDKYVLASPETATDLDYENIEAIIAHEYFHNWTGDRITCRDWFQLCLKEGLTVFRDQEFSADMRSRPVERIGDVRTLKSFQFAEDAGPLAHSVRPDTYREINNFYTVTVYEKGAEVVRMLKTLLGARGFRKGMDLYFKRHDGDAATVEDFLKCFADANKRDLSQFARWYSQAGTPELAVRGSYDAKAKTYTLDIEQMVPPTPGQSAKQPAVIPLKLGLLDEKGRDIALKDPNGKPVHDNLIVLDKASQQFVFSGVKQKPAISLNRGFSAPVKLSTNFGEDNLRFLAKHDSDAFNRYDAVEQLAMQRLVAAAKGSNEPATVLIEALSNALDNPSLDNAFLAELFSLPEESDVAQAVGKDVDPDAVLAARRRIKREIGVALKDKLDARYRKLTSHRPYSPDANSAGQRALRNICLDLLAATEDKAELRRALTQFEEADNMTDRMAALGVLSQHATPEREQALDAFEQRYRNDPLVLDKWFAVQARIPEAATLERVQKLMKHPAFSMTNPNRLRSLIGVFAAGNPSQFNRPDGKGYALLADTVLGLDSKNPQVAARLLSSLKSWRMLEPGRRALAEKELNRIAQTPGLSPDVADIAARSLA
ncbi:MAG: aminopeptidase N [Xanthobacteraceae bacterium]|nr:aminopeptidase N [Xanthobacteraceae bacterium]MCW5678022.1 aminopeptidase N [Xanthobacteraceae bacterium]